MLDYLNTAACALLMAYSLPLAMAIGNRGLWLERLSIVAVQIGLFLRFASPWFAWVPSIIWSEAWVNIAAAVMITVWRRRAWIFVTNYVAPVDLTNRRRREDWPKANVATGH